MKNSGQLGNSAESTRRRCFTHTRLGQPTAGQLLIEGAAKLRQRMNRRSDG